MAIDILTLEPNVVSRDLRGKYVMLYGKPKSGKTTAAASFPKSLLLAFEKGYNAIGGIIAQDIMKWADVKMVLRQLEKPEAKEKFDTIIFDTIPIAWEYVENYVCSQNGVTKISEISWGQGYAQSKKEFESTLRRITQLGYGVVLLSHSSSRIEKQADGSEVEIISPDLPKRAAEVCNGIVDLIGYIGTEFKDGKATRWLYTRETPTLFAGSRFKYMEPKIPFSYEELVKAVNDAITKAEELDGITVTDKPISFSDATEKLDYKALMEEAKDIWAKVLEKGQTEEEKQELARNMLKKVELVFNQKIKLSEITEDQVSLLNIVLLDLREML